jgi:hypothetical protein
MATPTRGICDRDTVGDDFSVDWRSAWRTGQRCDTDNFQLCRKLISDLGIGLHLQQLAQAMPAKYDLHESERLLAGLDPYDHLRRVFRLCTVHAKRNIKSCAVDEPVRHLMRSLICMRHPSWDETIVEIQIQGGKAGNSMCPLTRPSIPLY